MGHSIVWLVIMLPVCLLMTGLGIFAFRRKEPMWFWSGTKVKPEEIADVPAYNRANGIMWTVYSLAFWISTAVGLVNMRAGGILLVIASVGGSVALMFAYHGIYEKYRVKQRTDRDQDNE